MTQKARKTQLGLGVAYPTITGSCAGLVTETSGTQSVMEMEKQVWAILGTSVAFWAVQMADQLPPRDRRVFLTIANPCDLDLYAVLTVNGLLVVMNPGAEPLSVLTVHGCDRVVNIPSQKPIHRSDALGTSRRPWLPFAA